MSLAYIPTEFLPLTLAVIAPLPRVVNSLPPVAIIPAIPFPEDEVLPVTVIVPELAAWPPDETTAPAAPSEVTVIVPIFPACPAPFAIIPIFSPAVTVILALLSFVTVPLEAYIPIFSVPVLDILISFLFVKEDEFSTLNPIDLSFEPIILIVPSLS